MWPGEPGHCLRQATCTTKTVRTARQISAGRKTVPNEVDLVRPGSSGKNQRQQESSHQNRAVTFANLNAFDPDPSCTQSLRARTSTAHSRTTGARMHTCTRTGMQREDTCCTNMLCVLHGLTRVGELSAAGSAECLFFSRREAAARRPN